MTYTVEITQHTLSQRSPARSGIENRWPKGKAKVKGEALSPGLLWTQAARPVRAKALSPGHRPGYKGNQQGAL